MSILRQGDRNRMNNNEFIPKDFGFRYYDVYKYRIAPTDGNYEYKMKLYPDGKCVIKQYLGCFKKTLFRGKIKTKSEGKIILKAIGVIE